MIRAKIIFVLFLLRLCWTLAAADEDNENFNNIDDLEDTTLRYIAKEFKTVNNNCSYDKLIESVNLLGRKISELESSISYKQAQVQGPHTICTTVRENSNTELQVLDIKCPKDRLPESCSEVNECKSDIYSIMIPKYSNHSLVVSCDLKTENGGWTVIQRRQDGSIDFYRNWTEYEQGFGDISGEFFIGLEKLHILTTLKPQELYIILEDFEGEQKYAKYQSFKIDSKDTEYQLTVGNYSGNAGDNLTYHSGQKFETWDLDSSNCANTYKGAWWHKSCYESNLNGKYLMGKLPKSKSGQGISWNSFRGSDYSLKFVQMMIRPYKK